MNESTFKAPLNVGEKPIQPLIIELPDDDHINSHVNNNSIATVSPVLTSNTSTPSSAVSIPSTASNKKHVHFAPGTVSPEHRPPTPLKTPIILPTASNYKSFGLNSPLKKSLEVNTSNSNGTVVHSSSINTSTTATNKPSIVAHQVQERPMTTVNPEEEEDKLHFREIQSEYHRRRHQMIAASRSPLDDTTDINNNNHDNDAITTTITALSNQSSEPGSSLTQQEQSLPQQEQAKEQEQGQEQLPPKRISRFKASRLGRP
ncbi:hypothetical protein BDF19DRAFT_447237 [Syncephalis fuscata]|nr:hypothetical protein BDF19DRAFT_447237 [Syncephalis fuscata]